MTFSQWLLDLFKDERGAVSVKPVIGVFGAVILGAALIINIFSAGDVTPDGNIIDAIVVITVVGMTGDSIDKFSFLKKKPVEPNPDQVS